MHKKLLIFVLYYVTIQADDHRQLESLSTDWAHSTLQQLTIDEKIGQLFMVPAVSDESLNTEFMQEEDYVMNQEYVEQLIQNHKIGGVIFLGKGNPEKQIEVTQRFQSISNIPLLIGQDLEWGLSMRLANSIRFPRNMTLGAIDDDQLLYNMGYEIGCQMRNLGVHVNFAPVVDVNNNAENPVINDRSFGENKEAVAHKGKIIARGLRDAGAIPCAKHFPGHGDTETNSHDRLPKIEHNTKRLDTIELYPFKQLIDDGIEMIMIAHLAIPALEPAENLPTSLSYNVVTKLLREKLGFKGLIITDGLGMHAVTNHHELGQIGLRALTAGNDIILCTVDVPASIELIKQAINNGTITQRELDEHVYRILRIKEQVIQTFKTECNLARLHTPQAYALKKRLYQEAVTVVRDRQKNIPITDSKSIAVLQCGSNSDELFTTAIADAMRCNVYQFANDTNVDSMVNNLHEAEMIVISMHGMNKFAQKQFGIADSTRDLINQLNAQGKKIILVLFGSPYSISLFDTISTITVAYEDDADAQRAAAQVVLGNVKAHGKLPVLCKLQE
ncbi:MAG TPA: glycoside hydrolase family 3 N-terminal domain-containing protein [Candidatus Babeliales bacterium]|nr:glycoside hydrolase family 3 N-terminal domain-containing protein [Candidatus Babeliales bacterium]